MGKLIAKRYRTPVMAYLADHTYVECGSGKAWGCWGGKTDGQFLTSGTGSTERANTIAETNERAGITRYLIDGVCHQAANRILAPAGILVSDARGYRLSLFIFGTYGRSSFNMHADVTGDHEECAGKLQTMVTNANAPAGPPNSRMSDLDRALVRSNKAYVARLQSASVNPLESLNRNVQRFMRDVDILVEGRLSRTVLAGLKDAKSKAEVRLHDMDAAMFAGSGQPTELVRKFDQLTDDFQDAAGNTLKNGEYEQLFNVSRDERIRLTDPQGVDQAYGAGTFLRAQSLPPQ